MKKAPETVVDRRIAGLATRQYGVVARRPARGARDLPPEAMNTRSGLSA